MFGNAVFRALKRDAAGLDPSYGVGDVACTLRSCAVHKQISEWSGLLPNGTSNRYHVSVAADVPPVEDYTRHPK